MPLSQLERAALRRNAPVFMPFDEEREEVEARAYDVLQECQAVLLNAPTRREAVRRLRAWCDEIDATWTKLLDRPVEPLTEQQMKNLTADTLARLQAELSDPSWLGFQWYLVRRAALALEIHGSRALDDPTALFDYEQDALREDEAWVGATHALLEHIRSAEGGSGSRKVSQTNAAHALLVLNTLSGNMPSFREAERELERSGLKENFTAGAAIKGALRALGALGEHPGPQEFLDALDKHRETFEAAL